MISLQRTVSSIFIVPLLGIRRERLHDEAVGFINAYLVDAHRDISYQDAVYLAFHPQNMVTFNALLLEERHRSQSGLIDEYDYEGGLVVLVYSLPAVAQEILPLLLNGKYSEFPEAVQALYPKVVKIKDPRSGLHRDEMALQWRIFRKDANLREYWEGIVGQALDADDEVWSLPDMNRETLDPEKLAAEFETSKP